MEYTMFCPRCGHGDYTPGYYCTHCGYHHSQPIQPSKTAPAAPQQMQQPSPSQVQRPSPQQQQPTPAQTYSPAAQQPQYQANPAGNGKKQKPARVKKRSGKGFFKQFLIFILVNAFLVFLWFAVGNYITLSIHSREVVETINNGSLSLSGVVNNDFDKLPVYVQNKLSRPRQENGPIIDLMLPYIRIETMKVNGFLGESTVEYKVTAPNVETWLLELDASSLRDENDFLQKLEEYIRSAPCSPRNVTINYHADGLFRWQGNYNTPEFLDAITGGMNTAYTELYETIWDELEDILQ